MRFIRNASRYIQYRARLAPTLSPTSQTPSSSSPPASTGFFFSFAWANQKASWIQSVALQRNNAACSADKKDKRPRWRRTLNQAGLLVRISSRRGREAVLRAGAGKVLVFSWQQAHRKSMSDKDGRGNVDGYINRAGLTLKSSASCLAFSLLIPL
jgi:hypothetical protein